MDINPIDSTNPPDNVVSPNVINNNFAPNQPEFNNQAETVEPVIQPVSSMEPFVNPAPQPMNQPQGLEQSNTESNEVTPVAVVKVLSPRGVEYVFMTIALFGSATGFAAAIISLLNGQTSFSVLAYPTAALVVSVPIFAIFFLRLKKSELRDPKLRLDPSKRRSTQFIQITSFIIAFLTLIGLVSAIFAKLSGSYSGSTIKLILDTLVILVIAGGILLYYWRDEHRP